MQVEYADLPDDRDGEYIRDLDLIRLRRGMTSRLHRAVLAHECGHARFGDVAASDPRVRAKQERRADEWAATHLIRTEDYVAAERLFDGHPGAMALELGVTSDVVRALQRVLAREGADGCGRTGDIDA